VRYALTWMETTNAWAYFPPLNEGMPMVTCEFTRSNKVLIVALTGTLTVDDLSAIAKKLDDHINQDDDIPNLLIHLSKMPHWDGFRTMKAHFRLVKNHHRLIKKVAVVGDGVALTIMPHIMDHFIDAKVRHFPEHHMEDAKMWAEAADDHPGGFEILDDLPRDVLALKVRGIITSQDYRKTLIPLVEKKLEGHDHLKLLIIFDDAFESYSGAAIWDDMRFGFSHLGDFSRIAIVTDLGWIRHSAKLFGPLIRGKVHIFDVKDLVEARSWITG
jgi:hypothetical protein